MAIPYIARYSFDTGPYIPPGTYMAGTQLSGGYSCTSGPVNYLDVSSNANEQLLWDKWWEEQIASFGQRINYYINGYNLSAHDYLYGEQPLVRFAPPISMVMAITLSNDNIILSKFGLQGDADLTAMVHIQSFTATVSSNNTVLSASDYEPKSGDLIELSDYGRTRPNGRSGRVFEITERVDEQGGENNQLLGHYIWMIKAKRFDFNYELDAPRESKMSQVYDNKYDGEVNNLPKVLENKDYTQFVDKDAKQIFNYDENPQANTSVYGDYDDPNTLVKYIGTQPFTGAVGASAGTYIVVQSPSNND